MPGVHQRADFNFGQFATGLEPGFNDCALLFSHRAALGEANQTEVITANIVQTIGVHGFCQESIKESVDCLVVKILFEVQVQLKTQLFRLTI